MSKEFWVNLPVKNVQKSKEFFTKIGFSFNEEMSKGDDMACLLTGIDNVTVMFFSEAMFKSFSQHELTDTAQSSETMLSFNATAKEEVDEMAQKVKVAGGDVFGEPAEIQGWMYGCGFSDPDGHRWNILYKG